MIILVNYHRVAKRLLVKDMLKIVFINISTKKIFSILSGQRLRRFTVRTDDYYVNLWCLYNTKDLHLNLLQEILQYVGEYIHILLPVGCKFLFTFKAGTFVVLFGRYLYVLCGDPRPYYIRSAVGAHSSLRS
jgi:hypothetical protein